MTRAILMLIVVLVATAAFPALQEPKAGTVEVLAFDITGLEIPKQYLEARLVNSDGQSPPITFRDGIAANVPYGAYVLHVRYPGFYPEQRSITLFRPRAVYHFTLEVVSVADTG